MDINTQSKWILKKNYHTTAQIQIEKKQRNAKKRNNLFAFAVHSRDTKFEEIEETIH